MNPVPQRFSQATICGYAWTSSLFTVLRLTTDQGVRGFAAGLGLPFAPAPHDSTLWRAMESASGRGTNRPDQRCSGVEPRLEGRSAAVRTDASGKEILPQRLNRTSDRPSYGNTIGLKEGMMAMLTIDAEKCTAWRSPGSGLEGGDNRRS